MNDREFKAQRKRIRKLWAKWRDILGLYAWDCNLNYYRGPIPVDGQTSFDAAACASVNWDYQRATLNFNLVCVMGMEDVALEECIVHECTHVLINEMRQDWTNPNTQTNMQHEEHTTTLISRAFIEALKATS